MADMVDSPTPAPGRQREGVETRLFVLMVALAVVAGFFGGRLLLIRLDPGGPPPLATASAAASLSTAADDDSQYMPYAGEVVTTTADSATGACAKGQRPDAAEALIDRSDVSIWRCRGEGIGEKAVFHFDHDVTLVALRVINGNTAWGDRYEAERRITGIRWTFDDGSFFDQGLAPNDRSEQEVRFPETVTRTLTMTVLAVTEPGDHSGLSDAVSISSLEFLAPA